MLFRSSVPTRFLKYGMPDVQPAKKFIHWLFYCRKKDYLTGANFTAADAYLFVVTNWAGKVGLSIKDLSALQTFMHKVYEREAVQTALKAEGLVGKQAAA